MKQEVTHSLVELEKEELQKLCCEVKETIATGIAFPNKEITDKVVSFGIADLWSLQKKMKTAGNRNRNLITRG
jgi:hypothetical protein